jgi:vacuolar protein sorting-associated protein 13A/C
LIKQIFKIVGSIDILGNPLGLFKNIGQGVFDFVDKPIEGFINGPLGGGIGLIKGTGSLVKNTLAGTFNSVEKITGSIGSGFSSLSNVNYIIIQG